MFERTHYDFLPRGPQGGPSRQLTAVVPIEYFELIRLEAQREGIPMAGVIRRFIVEGAEGLKAGALAR